MKLFNRDFRIHITNTTLKGIIQSQNINSYDCPLTRAHIDKINYQINSNSNIRQKIYGAIFAYYLKSSLYKYCESKSWFVSDEITYYPNTKSYSFNIYYKFNRGYRISDSIHKLPTICQVFVTFSISVDNDCIRIITNDSYEFANSSITQAEKNMPKNIITLKNLHVISVLKSSFPIIWDSSNEPISFWFEDSVLKIANNYYTQMISDFEDIIKEIYLSSTNLKVVNGYFLNMLHICHPCYYYSAMSYQIISAVWRKAIIVFPLFKDLSNQKQIEILDKAFKEIKLKIGQNQISSSEYAQSLYYQIVDNNLDTILAIPNRIGSQHYIPQKKIREKWGRSHSPNFYHSRIPPTELVWVQYGSKESPTTYLVCDIWNMINEEFTPNSPFNIDFSADFYLDKDFF